MDRALGKGCRHQRGLGLLEAALLVLLIAGVLALGILSLRAPAPADAARAHADALAWADRALAGFAASHGRLPCPASQAGGAEDCASGAAKGWLPTRTLGVDGSGLAPDQTHQRYLVYRGADDLAAQPMPNVFNPRRWNDEAFDFDHVNELDLCQTLVSAMAADSSAADAHIDGDGGIVNIAYGIASPGTRDADGDGSLFDGANAGAAPRLERPGRGLDSAYDDQVRVRDFATLATALSCTLTMTSLHALARAAGMIDEVAGQRAAIRSSAITTSIVNGVKMAVQIALGIKTAVGIAAASTTLSAAVAALAGAIASCVVLIGCAFIAPYTAAVVSAGVAIALSVVAVAEYVAAAAMLAVAMAKAIDVAIRAGATDEGEMPDWGDYADSVCGLVPELEQSLAERIDAYESALQARDTALQQHDSAWQGLRGYVHSDHWPRLDTMRAAAWARHAAVQASADAQANVDSSAQRLNDLNEALATTQANLANETDPQQRAFLEQTIINLQQEIANTEVAHQQVLQAAQQAEQHADSAQLAFLSARQNVLNVAPADFLLSFVVNNYLSRQETLYEREMLLEHRRIERDEAADALVSGQDACTAAQALQAGEEPPPGTVIGLWGGAESILRAADEKGAVR